MEQRQSRSRRIRLMEQKQREREGSPSCSAVARACARANKQRVETRRATGGGVWRHSGREPMARGSPLISSPAASPHRSQSRASSAPARPICNAASRPRGRVRSSGYPPPLPPPPISDRAGRRRRDARWGVLLFHLGLRLRPQVKSTPVVMAGLFQSSQ